MYEEGQEVHFGHYKVVVEEVDERQDRCLVDVKTNSVDWEGYVSNHLLQEEKFDYDNYPWPTDD